jgi:prolyl-tRNA editing enzyme YbaK/EbsC (Cys-tRNA(Pro) deacylase)
VNRPLAAPLEIALERLERLGVPCDLRRFPEGTARASDAAAALGVGTEQIAKTVVFRGERTAVLAVVGGDARVGRRALERTIGQRVEPAPGSYLLDALGVAPGAATPLIAPPTALVVIDKELVSLRRVWIAAGTPDSVVGLDPRALARGLSACVAPIAARSASSG